MSSFSSKRRERFLNEESSSDRRLGLHEDIADAQLLLDTSLGKEGSREDGWFAWNWAIASAKRRLFVHSYSDGSPMEQLAADFPGVLVAQEPSSLPHPLHETEPFYLEELDGYHYAMTFLSLAKLLRHDDLVPRVVALFDVAYTDIDDSSYRDLPFYPKDLVDYARTHGPIASLETNATLAAQDGPPVSTRGVEVCPK